MSKPLYSASWYRVAMLKPRLRSHVQIHRHYYREQIWFVLQDLSCARYYRFTPSVNQVIGLMDGERTVHEIWDTVLSRLGDDAPTQDDVVKLLGQLHANDVLQCDTTPDSLEVFQRYQRKQRDVWKQRLMSPLSIRFPLLDPDRFLERWMPLVHPLFGWIGALGWLAIVATAAALAAVHWPELTDNAVNRALAPYNLLLLCLVYPFIKVLHELGHAFATKVWGGEVHEMGITLLVFMPVPYVDASSASAFRDKRQRMVVSAAGILVELLVAALALFVWLSVEPGVVREIAFNVMLIGAVSTLLFNGNPLLRFDGYYVLADLVEIPNLATRSKKYLSYLLVRYLYGVHEARSPAMAKGEAAWFLFYGVASFVFRIFIMSVVVLYVAGKFFVVGMLLAFWIVVTQLLLPVLKHLSFFFNNAQIRHHQFRAISSTALVVGALLSFILYLPLPLRTLAEGVVWLPEQSQVRAATDGIIVELLAVPGSEVQSGDPLFKTEDVFLQANVRVLESQLQELRARYGAQRISDRVQAALVKEDMAAIEADLALTRNREDQLIIRSPATGTFIVPSAEDLPGQLAKQGQVLGYVADATSITARVVVTQADVLLVRERTQAVHVKFADRVHTTLPAFIKREVPAANYMLPSKVLGAAGGGKIPVDPSDERGTKALEKTFQLDVAVLAEIPDVFFGERVHVRFDHGKAPLAERWYRSMSRLLLRSFGV